MYSRGFTWNIKSYFLWKAMKKYLWMSSAAVVIGALRVKMLFAMISVYIKTSVTRKWLCSLQIYQNNTPATVLSSMVSFILRCDYFLKHFLRKNFEIRFLTKMCWTRAKILKVVRKKIKIKKIKLISCLKWNYHKKDDFNNEGKNEEKEREKKTIYIHNVKENNSWHVVNFNVADSLPCYDKR